MIAALLPIIGTVLDKVIPDSNARAEAKEALEAELVTNSNAINLAIQEINKTEAQHRSVFVAGWRPFIGWVAGAGFAWAFVGQPVAVWVLALTGSTITLPELDTAPLLEMTFAMLGLAGLRSYEKSKGLTK